MSVIIYIPTVILIEMQRLFGFGGGTGSAEQRAVDPKLKIKIAMIEEAFNADELSGSEHQQIKQINT